MKSKQIVLLALAVVCGLVAAAFAAKYNTQPPPEMETVLVAKKPLPQNTVFGSPKPNATFDEHNKVVSEELMEKREFPKGQAPQGAIPPNRLREFFGWRVMRTLRAGDHVTEGDLTKQTSITLPPNKYGYGAKVTIDQVAGGFVLAGSNVDVILTERLPENKARASVLLTNVKVVAIDTDANRKEGEYAKANVATVTLAVDLKETQKLEVANARGTLRLVLHSEESVTKDSDIPAPLDKLATDKNDEAPPPPPETETVIVAKEPVGEKTKINSDNFDKLFRTQEIVKGTPVGPVVKSRDALLGKVVVAKIETGAMVYNSALADKIAEEPKPVVKAPVVDTSKRHVIIVRNGDRMAYTHYKDDIRVETPGEKPTEKPE